MKRLLAILVSFLLCSMVGAENFVVSNIYNVSYLDYSKDYKGVKQIKLFGYGDKLESVANFDTEGRLVSDTLIHSKENVVILCYYGLEIPNPQINDTITYIIFHYKDDNNIIMKFINASDKEMGDSILLTLNSRNDLTRADYYLDGSVFKTVNFQTSWTADGNSCTTKRIKNNKLQGKTVTTYKNKKPSLIKSFDANGNPIFIEDFNVYGDLVKKSFDDGKNSTTISYNYDNKGHWISMNRVSKSICWGDMKSARTRQIVYY